MGIATIQSREKSWGSALHTVMLMTPLLASSTPPRASFDVTPELKHAISPKLYSMFFETEINFGGEGGLYAELLHNRDFEALGRGKLTSGEALAKNLSTHTAGTRLSPWLGPVPPLIPTDFSPWAAVGSSSLSIVNGTAPFATNPHSLLVRGSMGDGVANSGYWGVGVRPGVGYQLRLYALSSVGVSLRALVRCSTGEVVTQMEMDVPAGDQWHHLSKTLPPPARACSSGSGGFELQLMGDGSSVYLDSVSLMHSDAIEALFRKDIFDRLAAMHPGFIRTPGGCYLEGNSLETRWNWKQTLGPAPARSGHYNSAWGYWVTDGLGVFELLRLSELLGTESQISIYTGYSMGPGYVPLNESAQFATDAVDLLAFANDDGSSVWGRQRIAMGHASPFGLRRLEIGNEEYDLARYSTHYKLISDAVWAVDSSVHVVASGRWRWPGGFADGNPCLDGARCDEWDDHYYRTPDEMAALGTTYDNYNRSWPKVFVGEFAACKEHGARTLRAAVAEAVFMLGFERNADVVTSSSFAPLLNNVKGTQWSYNLINFNSTHLFALPSYYAQRMLSESLQAYVLEATQAGGHAMWTAVASSGGSGGTGGRSVTIKLANYNASVLMVDVTLDGTFGSTPASISASVLTAGSADAQNTLDEPEVVAPTSLKLQWDGTSKTFTVPMPAWSLAIINVTLKTNRDGHH